MKNHKERQFLVNESLSLLNRLEMVQPFALNTPMVRAAAISALAQDAINKHMEGIKKEIRQKVGNFITWLKNQSEISPEKAQAEYAMLKLRFNNLLDQLDIFADVLLQRGEHNTGTWVAGLDVLAADSLQIKGNYFLPPPMICFLERGHGAAIRRARTRLPGGDENPVAVIQVPRERMVGSGIASSLIHEVGHQGSELLGLTSSIREEIKQNYANQRPWELLNRWLNEILSDFWAMAHIGISATYGLMSVVSLPSYFVFRIATDAPHPFPWIRVKISIAFGKYLYPHQQWHELESQWEKLYPVADLPEDKKQIIQELEEILPLFAESVANHAPKSLKGVVLKDIFPFEERHPEQLLATFKTWQKNKQLMVAARPTLVFAAVGQAKAVGIINAHEESKMLTKLLTQWALDRAKNYCLVK